MRGVIFHVKNVLLVLITHGLVDEVVTVKNNCNFKNVTTQPMLKVMAAKYIIRPASWQTYSVDIGQARIRWKMGQLKAVVDDEKDKPLKMKMGLG